MADGRRCSSCCVTWPDTNEYSKCPECESATDRMGGITPLDDAEAWKRKTHAEFARHCEKLDAERQRVIDELEASLGGATVDGPSAA